MSYKYRYPNVVGLHRWRWFVGPSLVCVITLVFIGGLTQFSRNPSPYIIEVGHPYRDAEAVIKSTFEGSGEQTLLVVAPEDTPPFDPSILSELQQLAGEIENMQLVRDSDIAQLRSISSRTDIAAEVARRILFDEVVSARDRPELLTLAASLKGRERGWAEELILRISPVRRTRSLTNVEDIEADGDWLEVGPLWRDEIPTEPKDLKRRVSTNPLYLGGMVSPDLRATAIQIEYAIPNDNASLMAEAHRALKHKVEQHEIDASFAGTPVLMAEVGKAMEQDNARLLPFVLLLMGIILALCLRSRYAVVLTITVALLTVIWTVGLMSLLGIPLNIITNIMPVILITIAIADAVHLISRVQLNRRVLSATDSVEEAVSRLWRPMLLTSLTTAVGFSTLALTRLDYIRHFGIFLSIGAVMAFVITIWLLPGLLLRMPSWAPASSSKRTDQGQSWIVATVQSALSRPRTVLSVALVLAIVAAIFGAGIKPGFSNIESFKPDTEIRQDHARIAQHYKSMIPIDLWIESDQPRGLIEPEVVAFMERLENSLREEPHIGFVIGPASFMKRIYQVLEPGVAFELPKNATPAMYGQLLLLYENGNGQQIRDVLDIDYRNGRIIALADTDEAADWSQIFDRLLADAAQHLPAGITLHPSGHGWFARLIMVDIAQGQIISLALAVTLISLMMATLFRSALLGLIGIAPILVTLALNFAWMRALGIPLDIGTAMVAAVTFGIGIDYSIHLLEAIRTSQKTSWAERIQHAVGEIARPVLFNSVALAGGFVVLVLAQYAPIRLLGVFVACTLLLCAACALILLPLLISVARPRSLLRSPSIALEMPS